MSSMIKFATKIKVIWFILTGQYKHWALLEFSEKDIEGLLMDESYDVNIMYYGMHPFLINKVLFYAGRKIDEIDLLEQRLKFENEAEDTKA